MRSYRTTMVQTEVQVKFICEAFTQYLRERRQIEYI